MVAWEVSISFCICLVEGRVTLLPEHKMILAALRPPEIVVFSDIIRNRFRARSEPWQSLLLRDVTQLLVFCP